MPRLPAAISLVRHVLWALLLIAVPGCGSSGDEVPATPSCTPKSCEELAVNCGSIDDGCGNKIACGACPVGETCGGGGKANVCGVGDCTPRSCADQGKNCGSLSDGCSATLNCGTCAEAETCGGGGVANVCGSGADAASDALADTSDTSATETETPDTFVPDTLEPDTGAPDTFEPDTFVPDTFEPDTFEPDTFEPDTFVPDTFVADTFAPDTFVADTFEPDTGAPDTFVPDAFVPDTFVPDTGADTGGGAIDATLNVITHAVSGSITLNGAAPTRTCSSASPATVRFVDASRGYDLSVAVTCDSAFSFAGQVYPGTYKVYVRGTSYSNLPQDAWYLVDAAFDVSGARPGLVFDVKTFVQSGSITLNGAPPTRTCSSASPATVRFVDETRGYDLSLAATCDTAFSFSGQVYPGTYKVYVRGTSYSNLPQDAWYLIDPTFVVAGARSGLAFDVKTFVQSGSITLNGAPPTRTCSSASPGTIRFVEETRGYDLSVAATCDTAFSFSGQVYPGTYKVYVRGTSYSNLPQDAWYLIDPAFVVAGAQSGLVFNVKTFVQSGSITLNGAPPTRTCSSASPATIRFVEETRGYDLSVAATCDTAFSFSGQVYPGTYKVYVRGTSYSNLPQDAWYLIDPAFAVSAARAGLVFDVKTFVQSGSITLNGAPPTRTCSSASPATVRFVDSSRGYDLTLAATCDTAFSFSGQIYPGTYKVYVRGTSYSNLPQDAWYLVHAAKVVSSTEAGIVLPVVTRAISGTISLNGMAPSKTCSSASPATVRFVDETRGYDLSIAATCTTDFAYSGQVYPGTYRVLVRGTSYSNLPQDAWYVAIPSLVVP